MPPRIDPAERERRKKAWRDANRELLRALRDRWEKANPEKVLERRKRYLDKNRERRNARLRAQYAANPEPFKRRSALADAKRIEAKRAGEAQYRDENRPKLRQKDANYRKNNPEKVRASWSSKAARRAKAEGTHTGDDIKALFAYQKGRCPICRESIKKKFHIDHIMPLIRGGRNDRSNLQLLCPTCNMRKGPKDPIVFAQERGLLL